MRHEALAALRHMRHLEPNWDSYGAVPIDPRAIERATLLLDSLQGNWRPVPMSDGGVQLELHEGGFDIEITVRAVYVQVDITSIDDTGRRFTNGLIPADPTPCSGDPK